MSVTCPDCGAVAGYGQEIGHKSDCPSLRTRALRDYSDGEIAGEFHYRASLAKGEALAAELKRAFDEYAESGKFPTE
jgi:hypothetical protein